MNNQWDKEEIKIELGIFLKKTKTQNVSKFMEFIRNSSKGEIYSNKC